jgi:NADH-quinone oxidoreductase subunit A
MRQLGWFGMIEMLVFMGILFIALAYIWRKGGLDWE